MGLSVEQRICLRCLIRDLAMEDYEQRIGKYIAAISDKDRADDELYEYRLSICKLCEKLVDGTCLACGCYVELRAAAKNAACPHKKWQDVI